jgi:uncharacterized membrane protein
MAKFVKTDPAYSGTMLVYVLLLGAVLLPAAFLAALIGLLVTRDRVAGTDYQGHALWQLVTGAVGMVAWGVAAVVYLYVGPATALWVGLIAGPWYLYRLLRGGALFWVGEPISHPLRLF